MEDPPSMACATINDDDFCVLYSFQHYLSHVESKGDNQQLCAMKCLPVMN